MLSVINDEMSKIGASETSARNILTLNVTFVLFLDDIAPLIYMLMSAYDITDFLRAAYRLTAPEYCSTREGGHPHFLQ